MGFSRKGFDSSGVELLAVKRLYKGFFEMAEYQLRHRLFGGGWSKPFTREMFLRGSAVGALLYDPVNDLVGLLEQFRPGALNDPQGAWLLEVVAGIMEPDESPEEVARRELVEEAGITEATLLPVADFLVTPGGSDERMTLFCALTDLQGRGGIHGLDHENEDIYLHIVSRDEAVTALNDGLCNNAPLTIAMQWLCLHYEGIQKTYGQES